MTERIPFPDHAWPLMKRALEHIAEHPGSFYMPAWVIRLDDFHHETRAAMKQQITAVTGQPIPACGTVACLAGWITLLDHEDRYPNDVSALEVLGLPTDWEVQDGFHFFRDDASRALAEVFEADEVRTYADLCVELQDRFSFPEPLPTDSVVTP